MVIADRPGSRGSRCARGPSRVTPRLRAVDAGLLDLRVQRRALGRGDLGPVAQQPQAGGQRRTYAQRAPARGRLASHRHVVGLEAKAASRCHGIHGDVAAARSQGVEDELAIPLELVHRRPAAEDVGADVAEAAVVGHHPHRHHRADPLAELVRIEAADRHHTPLLAELVPASHVALGRVVEHASGRGEEADHLGDAGEALPGVVGEAPQLDPVKRVAVEPAERHAGSLEAREALRERMRREAEAACVADRSRDAAGVETAVADLLVDAEGQVVVAA